MVMDSFIQGVVLIVVTCIADNHVDCRGSLDCFACTNATSLDNCHNTAVCGDTQHCFIDVSKQSSNLIYNLGCKEQSECIEQAQQAFVGRRDSNGPVCQQCCAVPGCNKVLCSSTGSVSQNNNTCSDNDTVNCAQISSIFDICKDIHHAKTVCRRWCGLCDLVDGNWGQWTTWGGCSVTCENGIRERTRTCSDPAPAHGGLDCTGARTDHIPCRLDYCPINGMWSSWQNWTACSTSCGVGVTRRHRKCDNPPPSRFGQHCFGDYTEFNICTSQSCGTDGGWAHWFPWQSCSGSCGIGLAVRERRCNDPIPEGGGRFCYGDSHEYTLCNNSNRCPSTNEVYSQWSAWYPCEKNLSYRNRTCLQFLDVTTQVKCDGNATKTEYRFCSPTPSQTTLV